MITVIELLSYPLFHNFKLLSDDSGLYNSVLGTGIFEWETKEDIDATFEAGEFVMTTLSSAKEDIRIAEEGFKALMQKKVSAIAIKSVYFSELSEELIRLSNLYHVPLFLFSDTYFDDIIYTVKSVLISNDHNATLVKRVAHLLESKEPETDLMTLSTEINPFFYDHFICAFCSPKVKNKESSLEEKTLYLDQFYESYLKMFKKNNPAHKSIYSLIKMTSGILLIFTYDNPDSSALHKALLSELSYLGLDEEHFRIGISVPAHGLAGLADNIRKSVYACTSCLMENRTLLDFEDIGLNQFLFPLRHDP